MSDSFPFHVNAFYEKKNIWRSLGIAGLGGIRPSKRTNSVFLFLNAPSSKSRPGRSHNIYKDDYDLSTGLFRYTGEGQKGDQTLTRGNYWLANSKKTMAKIHFFRQYNEGGLHEYLGLVHVESYTTELQKDVNGKDRRVFVFWLRPVSGVVPSPADSVFREIEFERSQKLERRSIEELEQHIAKLSLVISTRGPRNGLVVRLGLEYVRYKKIIAMLKEAYERRCQVCHSENFVTNHGFYSEVHHLIPWAISHDDSRENLVVVCANCHRKFHHAKDSERLGMFNQLVANFPNIKFRAPKYVA